MEELITRAELEDMIKEDIDYDVELFGRICHALYELDIPFDELGDIYQLIYTTIVIQGEIDNGGFYQYYGNSTAEQLNELGVHYFAVISAEHTSDLLQEVFDKIMSQSETFRQEYETIGIQAAFNKANEENQEIDIDEYDEFYNRISAAEQLGKLRMDYIRAYFLEE